MKRLVGLMISLLLMGSIPIASAQGSTSSTNTAAENSANNICAGLSGSEYSECYDSAVNNYLEAEANTAVNELLETMPEEDIEVGIIADDDTDAPGTPAPPADTTSGNNDEECAPVSDDPNVIQLGVGCSTDEQNRNVSDSSVFNVGQILTTSGQDTDQFLKSDKEGGPVVAFLLTIINFITLTIGSIAIILIIIGGLLMIVSEGDENRLQRGKGIVVAAIIGLIIAMVSYIIVTFFQSIFY